jgi:MYXO-CTERM domain-containing protein
MWFGQGPKADYSYDGDVVYHEFGHAVVDHTLKLVGNYHADEQGLVSSPGAMNEGLADYFAAAITGGSAMGEYAATDLAPGLKSIRDLANTETCPANLSGEVHADSKFWTGGLWKVRETLAAADQDKMDQAVFDVMAASPGGDLGFEDLTKLIITSVKSGVSPAAADALTKEMTDRGALPTCDRVIEYKDKPINSGSVDLGGIFWAPGKQDSAIAGASYAPGVIQFKVPIPAATELSVSFSEIKTGGGGTSIFGGGNPFAPSVLVRFGDDPIKFAYSPAFDATADLTAEAPVAGGKGVATVQVPAGATNAYVMIVNTGDQSGGYRNVNFAFSGQPPAPDAGPVDAGADAGPPPNSAKPGDDEGCGCRTAGGPGGSGWWLAGALLGLVTLRRRRNLR